jgi:predicted HicB family RNase H-like nuclease
MTSFSLSVRVDDELHQQLRKAAYEMEISINKIILEAIADWLKKHDK